MNPVMTFSEEFDRFRTWNGTSGVWDTSRYYAPNGVAGDNGELQWYVNPNHAPTASANPYQIHDGVLTITAQPAKADILPHIGGQTYTSGMMTTYHSFSQAYGYFEMRAQLPAGQGVWPAFWLLPVDGSWPPELDVMEVLGHQPNVIHTTVHTQLEGTKNISDTHYQTGSESVVSDTSSGFHIYGANWTPEKITWYFDGQQVFELSTPEDMNTPMYMLANLAVGGNWPGSPDSSTLFPAEMSVDYIRAYDGLPSGGVPTSVPAPLALGSGPDTVRLGISGDAYMGDARFVVTLDGAAVGGVQTVLASHALGESQFVDIKGDFSDGGEIGVRFLNDAWDGSSSTDRNLYVTSVSVNDLDTHQRASLFSSGLKTFTIPSASRVPLIDQNTLVVEASEDAWLEDARFLVSVDGAYIGGAHAVTASHALGETQRLTFTGNFGSGPHDISIHYINDGWGGSSNMDRNLYIHGVELDGVSAPNVPVAFYNKGTADFTIDTTESSDLQRFVFSDASATDFNESSPLSVDGSRFALDDAGAGVVRLYESLGRMPDAEGYRFWVDRIEDGASLRDIARGFLESAEFSAVWGVLDDRGYIERLYEGVLDRVSDFEGMAFWSGELAGGAHRADVLLGFSESVEYKQTTSFSFFCT